MVVFQSASTLNIHHWDHWDPSLDPDLPVHDWIAWYLSNLWKFLVKKIADDASLAVSGMPWLSFHVLLECESIGPSFGVDEHPALQLRPRLNWSSSVSCVMSHWVLVKPGRMRSWADTDILVGLMIGFRKQLDSTWFSRHQETLTNIVIQILLYIKTGQNHL